MGAQPREKVAGVPSSYPHYYQKKEIRVFGLVKSSV